MSDTARLFLNSVLSENMSLAFFLGILFMMFEAGTIKQTAKKALKYVSVIFLVNILGWVLNISLFAELSSLSPAVFFFTTIIGIIILKAWGELEGEYFTIPKFVLFLSPLFGSQLLINNTGHDYAAMLTVNSGYVVGFYLLFVLIAAIKEEIMVSDADSVFKGYSTLLAAIAMLALGVIGFQIL